MVLKLKLSKPVTLKLRCPWCKFEFERTFTHERLAYRRFLTRCPRCKSFVDESDEVDC